MTDIAWWCSSTPGQIWTWRYTPFIGVWVVAASLIGSYVLAHRRAGRAIDHKLLRRWCLGVLALFAVSEWPIGQLGVGYLATVGIGRYIVYTFVAAPLLLSGLPTWLVDRWLPWGSRRQRVVSLLTAWPVALLIFNLVLFGTHLPITIDTLKTTQLGSFAVDVAHLGAALVWWWPAIRREKARGAIQEPIRAFYLFASSVLMFVPAAFLTFSPLPLYGLYELAPPLWLGFDPIHDQQAAGIVMNVIGGFVLWGIIATLFLRWGRDQQAADDITRRARNDRILARMADLERSAAAGDTGPGDAHRDRDTGPGDTGPGDTPNDTGSGDTPGDAAGAAGRPVHADAPADAPVEQPASGRRGADRSATD